LHDVSRLACFARSWPDLFCYDLASEPAAPSQFKLCDGLKQLKFASGGFPLTIAKETASI
jgi:hypothetical protein